MSKTITIAGNQVKVSVKTSSKAEKTVKVEIRSKKAIIIEIPEGMEIDTDIFLQKHKNLLEKKYTQFLQKKTILKEDAILYKGKYYKLNFQDVEKSPDKEVIIRKKEITLFHEPCYNPYKILKKWMTHETKRVVDEVKQKYVETLGNPLIIRVAETTRWGYTRKNGVIVINWQLAALPPELSEYVIIHELAHLSNMNHQKSFTINWHKLFQTTREKAKIYKTMLLLTPLFAN
jgi:predicted metal-dependent hydrolase